MTAAPKTYITKLIVRVTNDNSARRLNLTVTLKKSNRIGMCLARSRFYYKTSEARASL